MKYAPCLFAAFLAASVFAPRASAAPVAYEKPPAFVNFFAKKTGFWNNPKHWKLGQLPQDEWSPAIRDNSECVLNAKVPDVKGLGVGGRGTSVLTVSEGADLTVLGKAHIGGTGATSSASGLVVMTGGKLLVGADLKNKQARLYIGCALTHSTPATVRVEGGELISGFNLGGKFPNTGVGTLSIVGTAPVVRAGCARDSLYLTPYGNVEFVLGADGVAPIAVAPAKAFFAKDSLLRVDGTAYRGDAATIPLIRAAQLVNEGARVDCAGFDPKYKPRVVFTAKGVNLVIKTDR